MRDDRSKAEKVHDRFWSTVDRRGPDDCWIRKASPSARYGQFWFEGRLVSSHRFAYEMLVGPIPAGLTLDHVKARGCTSRLCVNPRHLEPVTRGENVMRGDTITARNAAKTHCEHGHGLDASNTYAWRGKRICRECVRINKRAFRSRGKTKEGGVPSAKS